MGLHPTSLSYGHTDLQVSQQFQEVTRIWEATNSSLQQQLRKTESQLGQREAELQESQKKLTSSQDALQEKQKTQEDTQLQLQSCQADRQKTEENLKNEEGQRKELEQRLKSTQDRLRSTQDTLRRFSSCSSGIYLLWDQGGGAGGPERWTESVSRGWVCLALRSQFRKGAVSIQCLTWAK